MTGKGSEVMVSKSGFESFVFETVSPSTQHYNLLPIIDGVPPGESEGPRACKVTDDRV